MNRTPLVLAACVGALGVALIAFYLAPWLMRPPLNSVLDEADQALADQRFARCEELAREILSYEPELPEAIVLLGQALQGQGDNVAALEAFQRVDDSSPETAVLARRHAGELLMRMGRASAAESEFRRALKLRDDLATHRAMGALLGIVGRRWESTPHLLAVVRRGAFDPRRPIELMFLGNLDRALDSSRELELMIKAAPDDLGTLTAKARQSLDKNRLDEALQLYRDVIQRDPAQIEAHGRLGLMLAARGDAEAFLQWHQTATKADHPAVWISRGMFAQQRREPKVAVRCFAEAVRLDPDHLSAVYKLSQALVAIDNAAAAKIPLARHERLARLVKLLNRIYTEPNDVTLTKQVAQLTEELGRFWESKAWWQVALASNPRDEDSKQAIVRVQAALADASNDARTAPAHDPLAGFDLEAFPLPDWGTSTAASKATAQTAGGAIRFQDKAKQWGVEFKFFPGREPTNDGKLMFELTGGGVAAFDYDEDGRPDLYFCQGSAIPADRHESRVNRLFRNLADGAMEEISSAVGLDDAGFGQGVAAGDFNNDGFADLYVACIGQNQLYENNGDGTFTRVTENAGIRDDRWTTSCLMADLSGDGLPDLYDVNYLRGQGLFQRKCRWDKGVLRICGPGAFDPEQDQFWLNLGDGRFERRTTAAGFEARDGNGLGVIAADFDGSGTLDVFVANDETANFLFLNRSKPGAHLRFTESARARGLAFDGQGAAQACMGIAAADANGDGLIDLFITNFAQEANTLYLQQGAGLFEDATSIARLRDPGFAPLGFGTQFLDADLDSRPDLAVANGHIDDFTFNGQGYRMRPHFYRNLGDGEFRHLEGNQAGDYFARPLLGRAMASVDLNLDGKPDLVVSHLEQPAALLLNSTPDAGNHVAVRLRGVSGSRDAIGAVVRVDSAAQSWTRQLVAGDGYLASNERQLIFGLGEAQKIDRIEIHWPRGATQVIESPPLNSKLILVEGVEGWRECTRE